MQKTDFRNWVVGAKVRVPVASGGTRPYINFDNAASTPAFKVVLETVSDFLKWYSNVHRGCGYKSKLSSWAFEQSRSRIYGFVKASPDDKIVLFTRNTTESINHLASRFPFAENAVVLTTVMEHHSNELPWRKAARVVHVSVLPDGRIDEDDLQARLREHRGRIALLAVTGASNVTGYINPVHRYAAWAHEAGAKIFVDAAQLAPHRPIDMKDSGNAEHLDYLAFSAHKMYAPFGIGVLVGERNVFEQGDPAMVGGGTVDIVTLENAYWTDLPDKEEAGTPDIVGAVALGAVLKAYGEIGWPALIEHETRLTAHALEKLRHLPGVALFGDADPSNARNRLGSIPFNVGGYPHAFIAAVLSHEWAIGTRSGCFCAHPYVKCLLNVNGKEAKAMEERILKRDRSAIPGLVRASFGIYNTEGEIDVLAEALGAVAEGRFMDGYILDRERGEYARNNFPEGFDKILKL